MDSEDRGWEGNKERADEYDGGSADETIKEDVQFLKDASWFKGMQILGFVQDTKTGLLREVVGV
jgi:hypothetical protein